MGGRWAHKTNTTFVIRPYRGGNKGLYVLLSRTQAGPGRTVKQEEISRNHVQTFISPSVHVPAIRKQPQQYFWRREHPTIPFQPFEIAITTLSTSRSRRISVGSSFIGKVVISSSHTPNFVIEREGSDATRTWRRELHTTFILQGHVQLCSSSSFPGHKALHSHVHAISA